MFDAREKRDRKRLAAALPTPADEVWPVVFSNTWEVCPAVESAAECRGWRRYRIFSLIMQLVAKVTL